MHPEILRELSTQRGRDMQARAQQASLARAVSRVRRAIRRGTAGLDGAEDFAIPAIPDYVDGSFRTDERAASQSGHVPVGRRAA
jgi:hypothetical protein